MKKLTAMLLCLAMLFAFAAAAAKTQALTRRATAKGAFDRRG